MKILLLLLYHAAPRCERESSVHRWCDSGQAYGASYGGL